MFSLIEDFGEGNYQIGAIEKDRVADGFLHAVGAIDPDPALSGVDDPNRRHYELEILLDPLV